MKGKKCVIWHGMAYIHIYSFIFNNIYIYIYFLKQDLIHVPAFLLEKLWVFINLLVMRVIVICYNNSDDDLCVVCIVFCILGIVHFYQFYIVKCQVIFFLSCHLNNLAAKICEDVMNFSYRFWWLFQKF